VHHGMTKIASTADEKFVEYYDVDMKVPDKLFADLPKLDFVKCDVEGYERNVFGNMKSVIAKHRPIIQSELGGEENRMEVISILRGLNYNVCLLVDGIMKPATDDEIKSADQDFYFLPNK